MNNLLPVDTIKNRASFYLAQMKTGNKIYTTLLIIFPIILISLPFINIDITFQSRGQIRSIMDSNTIITNVSAKIKSITFQENQSVEKGDTLLTLSTDILNEKIKYNQTKIIEANAFINDLTQLTNPNYIKNLNTPLFRKELLEYRQHLNGINKKEQYFNHELNTSKTLYHKNVIAKNEYLKAQHNHNIITTEITNFKNGQLAKWQSQLVNFAQDTVEIKSQLELLKEEKQKYIIIAPISGTIKNYSGIKPGNFTSPNQTLAQISPDDKLIVECYVSPKDIGYLKKDTPVNFQVDAYSYSQWGLAKGKIIEIFNDVTIVNEQPIFRVRCELITRQMKLKSGFIGKLKKGMTLTSRFKVTQRTLWQLLYDKMDNWLNPTQNS